jgi:hypothetical protein
MKCILLLQDGRWVEQELPNEFLMYADKNLDKIQRKGRVVVDILDENTEVEVEYDCKDILLDYMFFNPGFMRSRS